MARRTGIGLIANKGFSDFIACPQYNYGRGTSAGCRAKYCLQPMVDASKESYVAATTASYDAMDSAARLDVRNGRIGWGGIITCVLFAVAGLQWW